jgi:hypothetical protein
VTADGNHRHTVFVSKGGKRAVVVVNLEQSKAISAKVALPNADRLAIVTPERPDMEPVAGPLSIPARSAAVILER